MSQGRVALVTGANRGIGFETCRQLLRQGFTVLLTARDEEKARQAAGRLQAESLLATPCCLDVIDPVSVAIVARQVEASAGRLDILINNAGVFLDRNASADSVDPELLAQTLEVNLIGALRVAQALIPLMKSHDYGRIVNLSSSMGCLTEMGSRHPAYRISKTALNALTRVLAADLAGRNILVNAACPGWVKTDMGGPHAERTPEEAVDTILWLATLPNGGPTGGLFRDRKRLPW